MANAIYYGADVMDRNHSVAGDAEAFEGFDSALNASVVSLAPGRRKGTGAPLLCENPTIPLNRL